MASGTGAGAAAARALRGKKSRVSTFYFKGDLRCLRGALKEFGWEEVSEEDAVGNSVIIWLGNHVDHLSTAGSVGLLTSHRQRTPRFDGLRVMCFKDSACVLPVTAGQLLTQRIKTHIALEALRELFPDNLNFWPKGWCLPAERAEFDKTLRASAKADEQTTYIFKPAEMSQGTGIFLAQRCSDLPPWFVNPPNARAARRAWVVQEYIDPCLLLDGFKFDLRLYVLVLSVDPLRVYLCREGMARLCSEQYKTPDGENLNEIYSHLTNYSLNKKNANYVFTPATTSSSPTHEAANGSGGGGGGAGSDAIGDSGNSASSSCCSSSSSSSSSSETIYGLNGGATKPDRSNAASPILPQIPKETSDTSQSDNKSTEVNQNRTGDNSHGAASLVLPSPSAAPRQSPKYSAIPRRRGPDNRPPTLEALEAPLYVNGDVAKDLQSFKGLFPTIATKLVERKPFKNRKELYSNGLDTEEERVRLKKYDRHIVFTKPEGKAAAGTAATTSPGKVSTQDKGKASKTPGQRGSQTASSNEAQESRDRPGSEKDPLDHKEQAVGTCAADEIQGGETPAEGEEDEEEIDLWLEDSDGPMGSKRSLADVLAELVKPENGNLQEITFWEECVDVVAKTMIAFQPSLALKYRAHFPRKRHEASEAGRDTIDEDQSEDDEDDEDAADDGDDARKGRANKGKKTNKKSKKKATKKMTSANVRPKILDQPPDDGEDGDDSFRCFHILGFDVLFDTKNGAHLLEVNSNPSLNIMHEAKDPTTGLIVAEVSPIDAQIKKCVVRDSLRLTCHNGVLPPDDDSDALGSFIPVITRTTESMYGDLMIFERIRQIFEHCKGLRFEAAGVSSSAFQRVARKMHCQASAADLVFIKICAEASAAPAHLSFPMFVEALHALGTDGGEASFAEKNDCESKAEILQAVIDAYEESDDEGSDED